MGREDREDEEEDEAEEDEFELELGLMDENDKAEDKVKIAAGRFSERVERLGFREARLS